MKNFRNLWMSASIVIGVLLIVSCEKTDVTTETLETQEEGFMGTTDYHDQTLDINEEDVQEPLLHMSFDENANEEMITSEWEKTVEKYIRKNPILSKTGSSEYYYSVTTVTGAGTYDNTDGKVMVNVRFNTDVQSVYSSYINLDNPGNDREYGSVDFYLLRGSIPGVLVSYVELNSASLALQGKDGWVPTQLTVSIFPAWQINQLGQLVSCTGYSLISSQPNTVLDNETSTGWAYYHTGSIGIGRLTFL